MDDQRSMSLLYCTVTPVDWDADLMAASRASQGLSPVFSTAIGEIPKTRSRVERLEPRRSASAPRVRMIFTRQGTRAASAWKNASNASELRLSISTGHHRRIGQVFVCPPDQEIEQLPPIALLHAPPPLRRVPLEMCHTPVARDADRREAVDHDRGHIVCDPVLRLPQPALPAHNGPRDPIERVAVLQQFLNGLGLHHRFHRTVSK